MPRLAFGYKKQSGKDYACEYLCNTHGFTTLRIAEPIYELHNQIQKYFSNDDPYFNHPYSHSSYMFKDRDLLRIIGMWGREAVSSSIWIDVLVKNLEYDKDYAVADLRFLNEAETLKENGFTLIKIEPMRQNDNDDHISETELDDFDGWDVVITNDFTTSFRDLLDKLV